MRTLTLTMIILVCLSGSALAQGAATGGTKDTAPAPTMVFPVRPRDEPARPTAVPNIPHRQQRVYRLRRHYYVVRPHR